MRTTDPARTFTIEHADDTVTFAAGESGQAADLELPAEAFVRLLYGRLGPDHTPEVAGDISALDTLRYTFPGP